MKKAYFNEKIIANPQFIMGGTDGDSPNDDLGGATKKKRKGWFGRFVDWVIGKK